MCHDEQSQKHRQPVLREITIAAAPPDFRHAEIAAQYEGGLYGSRWEAELADLLRDTSPLHEARKEDGTLPLTNEILAQLSCIAIIQQGRLLPVIDLDPSAPATTAAQKMAWCALAARAVLDGLIDVLQEWDTHRQATGDDEDDQEGCHVPAR